MQVSMNTQNYSHSTNFTSLKKVEGGKLLSCFIGDEGYEIEDILATQLKANKSFQTLCDKYDVFVKIKPHILGYSGILLDKGLSLEVFASQIKKGGFLGLFKKAPEKNSVTGYLAHGVEANTWDLAHNIIEHFIKPEKEMKADINGFLSKAAQAQK